MGTDDDSGTHKPWGSIVTSIALDSVLDTEVGVVTALIVGGYSKGELDEIEATGICGMVPTRSVAWSGYICFCPDRDTETLTRDHR